MRIIVFIFTLLLSQNIIAKDKTKVSFFKGEITNIKEEAKSQGKLYYYDFVASWCTPCRWMDETTYNDNGLARYIDDNYIAAKVDIDDFDGFELKNKYKITSLPTIIVFNQEGKVVGRYEESMGPTKLTEILKKHNTTQNGAGKITKSTPVKDATVISRPGLGKPQPPVTKNPAPTPGTVTKARVYVPGTGLYKMDISRHPNTGFSIQMISLGQYDNVVKTFEDLKKQHPKQSVLINIEQAGGKTTYKIMVGEFKTKEDAEKYKKAKAPDGYIKDLAKVK